MGLGAKTHPADKSIAEAFGSYEKPILLEGGQGTTYRSGDIILKPVSNVEEDNWQAEIFSQLPENNNVRFARPVKSKEGTWIFDEYVAWSFLEGERVKERYAEKLLASKAFHNLLKDIQKPAFLNTSRHSWAAANEAVWEKKELKYDAEFMPLINQITPHLKDLDLPNQLIHGDLSGNFLIQDGLPPAIIDFSPAWAPNGFAEGVMLADAIVWEKANPELLKAFKNIPHIDQLAYRGTLRRIIEQVEHIKWFGKDKSQALEEAQEFQKAIDYLNKTF